jgi:hypothetical protein
MKTHALFFPAVTPGTLPANDPTETLRARVSALYDLSQMNPHVFASPVGPFVHRGRSVWLPRFAFFGPHASDDSWRLSFLAGFDHRDLRSTHALLHLIESLAGEAEHGHGLNLTFFPLIDAAGLALDTTNRCLPNEFWNRSREPEIALLARDALARGYHGFVRIESAPAHEEVATLSLATPEQSVHTGPDVEIVSSDAFEQLEVRLERVTHHRETGGSPLDLADDLGIQPFELTLRLPSTWPQPHYEAAANHIITRFIHRYRAFQAYGGDL